MAHYFLSSVIPIDLFGLVSSVPSIYAAYPSVEHQHVAAFTTRAMLGHWYSTIVKADVNFQVLEYLLKKGYTKSEAMLRMESAAQDADGRPLQPGTEDLIGAKYRNAFSELYHIA